MKNIFLVVKNNLYRLKWERASLIMILFVMPFIIYFGIYFGSAKDIKGQIAIVGASEAEKTLFTQSFDGYDKIRLKFMDTEPSATELIKGIYLAQITLEDGRPEIISYGNQDIKGSLEAAFEGKTYTSSALSITTQGKIAGFLVMFFFFGGSMAMDFFLSDRDSGVYRRTLMMNVTYLQYILGQLFYTLIIFTLPSLLETFLIIKLLNVEISIGMGAFGAVILFIGLLSSSFAILVSTFCKNKLTTQMTCSAIAMISSLFGGCLIDVVDSNRLLAAVRNLIPQKRIIDLANEFGYQDMLYLLFFVLILISVSTVYGYRQYKRGDFL